MYGQPKAIIIKYRIFQKMKKLKLNRKMQTVKRIRAIQIFYLSQTSDEDEPKPKQLHRI